MSRKVENSDPRTPLRARLPASGYKRWRDFRTAQKIATIRLKFRAHPGNPG